MSAGPVVIRPCKVEDLPGVSEVCCRCGFGGEDIAESGVFKDRRLFAMLFCHYYLRYEARTSFVAASANDPREVVGYVLGCPDTVVYERRFATLMVPRIAARVLLFTSWRHPRVLCELIRWGRSVPWREANPAGVEYPAHLHIDLLPEYQRRGIGGRLLDTLEARFQELGVDGVHLVTSNHHRKALPFYDKHGYRVVREREHRMWSGLGDYRSIVYVKRLSSRAGLPTAYRPS